MTGRIACGSRGEEARTASVPDISLSFIQTLDPLHLSLSLSLSRSPSPSLPLSLRSISLTPSLSFYLSLLYFSLSLSLLLSLSHSLTLSVSRSLSLPLSLHSLPLPLSNSLLSPTHNLVFSLHRLSVFPNETYYYLLHLVSRRFSPAFCYPFLLPL